MYIGSTFSFLKDLKYFNLNPGKPKESFIPNPVISSIALEYLAYEKTVNKTSFLPNLISHLFLSLKLIANTSSCIISVFNKPL